MKLDCVEEAKQILHASLAESAIRHAIMSLRALREDLETFGDGPASVVHRTPSYDHGLQQYCVALKGLAFSMSGRGSDGVKSALFCCQIFISIEQVRKNYAALGQHFVRGLSIMHEYRARPSLDDANNWVPSHLENLPLLDVFIIKLFAAPCPFADPPETAASNGTNLSMCPIRSHQQPVEPSDFRKIAPDMRAKLTKIATSSLDFLSRVAHVDFVEDPVPLLSEKAALLDSLETWLNGLDVVQSELRPRRLDPISVDFMRLFHQILKLVLLVALDSSPDLDVEMQTASGRLQAIADNAGERVRDYRTCTGVNPEVAPWCAGIAAE